MRPQTPLPDSRNICLPKGLANPASSYRPLLGKLNPKKKRFACACSRTFTDGVDTQSLRVAGSLKYKR